MELSPHGFLEELLQAPRRDSWASFPTAGANNDFFSNSWSFDSFDESTSCLATAAADATPLLGFSPPADQATAASSFDCPFSDQTYPFVEGFTVPAAAEINHTSYAASKNEPSPFPTQEDYPSIIEDDQEVGLLRNHSFEERSSSCCKVEMEQASNIGCCNNNVQVFNAALCLEKKSKSKRIEGQPSKNLMAERRRRKRLNDRLSMLRSIVPKISKMDRTSILGDTIDYMKELLEKVNKLQEEESEEGLNRIHSMPSLRDFKSNEVLVRNSPKFNVERREIDTEIDTKIDICCAAKPGLLMSTVNTLEALGIEIQQCVISCFNDFSMQASCSEATEQRPVLSPEDIKQALFRTAGYGGRCL